jgi:hypothetical protein
MTNRILRDDPTKGKTPVGHHFPPLSGLVSAWCDKSQWGLYLLALIGPLARDPVIMYLHIRIKNAGFSAFHANLLAIPGAVIQIFTVLTLARSSNWFKEKTWHIAIAALTVVPLLAAMVGLPGNMDHKWGRYVVGTLISGGEFPCIRLPKRHSLYD